jgi:hypothetical protein
VSGHAALDHEIGARLSDRKGALQNRNRVSVESRRDAWEWWGGQRLRYKLAYNFALAAGLMTLILYLIAAAKRCSDISGLEVPLLTLAWQAAGYLVAMGASRTSATTTAAARDALWGARRG